jgi:hypothetical protein
MQGRRQRQSQESQDQAEDEQMTLTTTKALLVLLATVLISLVAASAAQAEAPVKLLVESQIGAKVNSMTGGGFCSALSGDTCKPGEVSTMPGGFGEFSPKAVAVDNDSGSSSQGNIYITDSLNERVQELTPTGEFVLMFGKDVNETTGGDVCTELEVKSGIKCKAGVSSAEQGGFNLPSSVAVDPNNGDVYVSELQDDRVDEFSENGQFILMIGREVNQTKDAIAGAGEAERNLCTAVSGDTCKAAGLTVTGSTEHGALNLPGTAGQLAAGGPKDLLYVGDEHRVQEFNADGTWASELPLAQISSEPITKARALALDQSNGDLYLEYGGPNAPAQLSSTVYGFDAAGEQIAEFVLRPREASARLKLEGIALDSSGRLAVIEVEEPIGLGMEKEDKYFGSLVNVATGKPITEFTVLPGGKAGSDIYGIAFSAGSVGAGEELYAASINRGEIVGYVPKVVAELVTGTIACAEEGQQGSSVVLECGLNGQVNPENVAKTEAFFLWSNTEEALDGPGTHETTRQPIMDGSALVSVSPAVIAGQRPNEHIYYELAGFDELVQPPEPALTGEDLSTVTPLVAPVIVGKPSVSFVKSSSAVMSGTLNPENASTEFYFEYRADHKPGEAEYLPGEETLSQRCPGGVREEGCPGVKTTAIAESAAYTNLATTLEATGLQPSTVYSYRLVGESKNAAKNLKRNSLEAQNDAEEGEFTTARAPAPQAETGPASAIGVTSATVSGRVDPDGQPATYHFELGTSNGAETGYGIVFSGSAGSSSVPVEERLGLAGLNPGTEYAYLISIESGYGTASGAANIFTTAGLPAALPLPTILPQLPTPKTNFPKEPSKPVTPRKLTPAQQLANALKACAKKPKSKHAACRREAHRRYKAEIVKSKAR